MNKILENLLKNEEKFRQKKGNLDDSKRFYSVQFFAGEEFNQALAQNQSVSKKNIIDFGQINNKEGKFIEDRIKEIENDAKNKQLIEKKNFPIIWFKNLDKIVNNPAVEKSLLPIFDPQQNTKLFGKKIDLSNYILIATSSSRDISQLSPPL